MYTGMFGRRISPAACLGFVILQFLLYAEAGGELASCPAAQEWPGYEASVESAIFISDMI